MDPPKEGEIDFADQLGECRDGNPRNHIGEEGME